MSEIAFQFRPPTQQEIAATANQLLDLSAQALGVSVDHFPFGLLAYTEETLVGSLIGKVFLNWLHVDMIWVQENMRRIGLGSKLMELAKSKAKEMGLSGIEVWTQSWQAPEFYRKLGYDEFATLDDFIPGQKRYAFRCYISDSARPPAPLVSQPSLPELIRRHVQAYFDSHGESLPSSGIYDLMMPLFEKPLIEVTLAATGGNQLKAAKILGINRNTLHKKIVELGITL
ncbi:MAG TPA: GNAT family N-acetyltransferase [Rickettsiales bacterium]|nr:GNAT family N-acetyltransferase [Rickettsiales bacterium]